MKHKNFLNNNSKTKNYQNFQEKKIIWTYVLISFLIFIFIMQIIFFENFGKDFFTQTDFLKQEKWFSVFTALFFHLSPIHLFGNLVAIFLFGRIVEKHLGIHILSVFIFGGILANVISNLVAYYFGEIFSSAGASSGIAALILLGILFNPISFLTPLGWFLISLDILGIYNGIENVFKSSTNHLAHIGGYLSLIFLFFFFQKKHKKKFLLGIFLNIIFLGILYFVYKYFL